MALPAIIPAGGTANWGYAQLIGTPHRALAPLGQDNTPALQIVINALRQSGHVKTITAVAHPDAPSRINNIDQWLTATESGPANILAGLAAISGDPDRHVFVCASDLPFITAAAVQDFAARCANNADMTIGLVRASAYENAYPDAPPSQYVTLRESGPVTLSCLFAVRPSLLTRNKRLLTLAFEARKSQSRSASLLGPRLLWQWATGTLSLAAVQARCERLLRCQVQVIDHAHPALAYDIDNADDYAYARARTNALAFP